MLLENAIKQRDNRYGILITLFEGTNGSITTICSLKEIANYCDIEYKEAERLAQMLSNEGYIKFFGREQDLSMKVAITNEGNEFIEELAIAERNQLTPGTPQYITNNIINGNIIDSKIQQAGSDSNQNIGHDQIEVISKLKELIKIIEDNFSQFDLSKQDLSDLEAELLTIKGQASSSRFKKGIVRESLDSIKDILIGISGNIIAANIIQKLPELSQLLL